MPASKTPLPVPLYATRLPHTAPIPPTVADALKRRIPVVSFRRRACPVASVPTKFPMMVGLPPMNIPVELPETTFPG
jgi:hypothetical protein